MPSLNYLRRLNLSTSFPYLSLIQSDDQTQSKTPYFDDLRAITSDYLDSGIIEACLNYLSDTLSLSPLEILSPSDIPLTLDIQSLTNVPFSQFLQSFISYLVKDGKATFAYLPDESTLYVIKTPYASANAQNVQIQITDPLTRLPRLLTLPRFFTHTIPYRLNRDKAFTPIAAVKQELLTRKQIPPLNPRPYLPIRYRLLFPSSSRRLPTTPPIRPPQSNPRYRTHIQRRGLLQILQ